MKALFMATAMAVASAPAAAAAAPAPPVPETTARAGETAPITPETTAPAEATPTTPETTAPAEETPTTPEASAPAPAEAAPAAPVPTHEVVPGESLSIVSLCEFGDPNRWVDIFELNRETIADPDIIVAGWILNLPAGASGECDTAPLIEAAKAAAPAPAARAQAAPTQRPTRTHTHTHAQAAPSSSSGSSSGGSGLASIRACESGGNYGAVSSSGKYRGAYQFDQQTWESVGGSGDPAAASPAEQDQRAAALQQSRGNSPWPSCG